MDLGSTNNLLQVRLGADIGEVYNELTKQRLGLQPGDFPMEWLAVVVAAYVRFEVKWFIPDKLVEGITRANGASGQLVYASEVSHQVQNGWVNVQLWSIHIASLIWMVLSFWLEAC